MWTTKVNVSCFQTIAAGLKLVSERHLLLATEPLPGYRAQLAMAASTAMTARRYVKTIDAVGKQDKMCRQQAVDRFFYRGSSMYWARRKQKTVGAMRVSV